MKIRGQAPVPGLHTFRITEDCLQTFPRTFGLSDVWMLVPHFGHLIWQ